MPSLVLGERLLYQDFMERFEVVNPYVNPSGLFAGGQIILQMHGASNFRKFLTILDYTRKDTRNECGEKFAIMKSELGNVSIPLQLKGRKYGLSKNEYIPFQQITTNYVSILPTGRCALCVHPMERKAAGKALYSVFNFWHDFFDGFDTSGKAGILLSENFFQFEVITLYVDSLVLSRDELESTYGKELTEKCLSFPFNPIQEQLVRPHYERLYNWLQHHAISDDKAAYYTRVNEYVDVLESPW